MLLETIRCENGEADNLIYHQRRMEYSLEKLGWNAIYDLESIIIPPKSGLYRCRFLYNADSYTVEFHPYVPKKISSLRLIQADTLEYSLKSADRESLNALFAQRGSSDDVLIVKNNLLCDTTIANIALLIDNQWLTPSTPLLEGTTRARLLDEGFLNTALLTPKDIEKAAKIAIMNAMVGFVEVENGIIS